jgi:hypothetical protein
MVAGEMMKYWQWRVSSEEGALGWVRDNVREPSRETGERQSGDVLHGEY